MMSDDTEKRVPGPKPDHLRIEGDWEDAIKKALQKERPEDGWPKPGDDEDKPSETEED